MRQHRHCKWIFKHKYNADGLLARHKARWIVRGFSQQYDVDYDETFSPVVKPATIRIVLSIAASRSWPIHQLDVKNAFLHGHLQDTVYCQASSTLLLLIMFVAEVSLWSEEGTSGVAPAVCHVSSTARVSALSHRCVSIYKDGDSVAYLLLYVDDIVLTASSPALLRHITECLSSEFAMTDLGALHHFLSISVTRSANGMFLSQRQYAVELL